MYYEEKLIDGILNWRDDPDKEFAPYSLAELSSRYVAFVDLRTERGKEKARDEIEVDVWTPERVARLAVGSLINRRGRRGLLSSEIEIATDGLTHDEAVEVVREYEQRKSNV